MLAETRNEVSSKYSFPSEIVRSNLESMLSEEFSTHPFSNLGSDFNYRAILSNYLAMSQAFPFLQAGSQKDLFFHYMNQNLDVPKHVEVSSVVGNFLCWDETGGLAPTVLRGMKGLPEILKTQNQFHANVLKKDLKFLFSEEVKPEYSDVTKTYLLNLYNGLSSLDPVKRCAYMVAFESHAHQMIDSLWESLSEVFSAEKNKLIYFKMHVGGNDPAEVYHVEMTKNLIMEMVDESRIPEFYAAFREAYSLNFNWCMDVVKNGSLN